MNQKMREKERERKKAYCHLRDVTCSTHFFSFSSYYNTSFASFNFLFFLSTWIEEKETTLTSNWNLFIFRKWFKPQIERQDLATT